MYHAKKFSTASLVPHKPQSSEELANVGVVSGGSSVKSPTPSGGSGKQRLRWTSDLHDRFVDAITQLGGPDRPWQVMLKQADGSFACVAESATRFTLGETKEELLRVLGLQEEQGSSLQFLRRGYRSATWWEEDVELEVSSAWRN